MNRFTQLSPHSEHHDLETSLIIDLQTAGSSLAKELVKLHI